jgi:hypothetical protein
MTTWVARAGAGLICTIVFTTIAAPAVTAYAGVTPSSLVPATHVRGAVCVVSGHASLSSPPGTTAPPVLAHPSAVAVVWLPGLNSRACKAVLTRGNAHIAAALASDIDGARVVPNAETYMCPDDDGTGARLYFMYAHGATQRIDAEWLLLDHSSGGWDPSLHSYVSRRHVDLGTAPMAGLPRARR